MIAGGGRVPSALVIMPAMVRSLAPPRLAMVSSNRTLASATPAAIAAALTSATPAPGGTPSAFCDAATTTSKPHASIVNSLAAKPLTESTSTSAPCARIASASGPIGFCTPVEVSLCVKMTPLISRLVSASSRAFSACASTPWPHAVGSTSTSTPQVRAISAKRSPKTPTGQHSTFSPGANMFVIAARSEDRLELARDRLQQHFELRTAMIDHRLPHRGEHGLGDGHGSWNEQQLLRHDSSGG